MTETGFALEELINGIIMPLPFLAFGCAAKTNPTRAWKAFAKTIGDRPDTGEAGPDRASTCRIRAVDARATRRRVSHYDRLTNLLDQTEHGEDPGDQREFRQRPCRKTDSSSMAETK